MTSLILVDASKRAKDSPFNFKVLGFVLGEVNVAFCLFEFVPDELQKFGVDFLSWCSGL